MLGALIAIFAGWNVKRLWPFGVLFLLIWPAIAVVIQLPGRRKALERLGETIELTPQLYLESYLMTALVSGLLFFVAFGLKSFFEHRKAVKSKSLNAPSDSN